MVKDWKLIIDSVLCNAHHVKNKSSSAADMSHPSRPVRHDDEVGVGIVQHGAGASVGLTLKYFASTMMAASERIVRVTVKV
jgi:hypothetical protein